MKMYDVIIIGAGAAGLMCAIEAGKRGRKVLVLDHAEKAGKKILISGGGRCNFTNLFTESSNFISNNPHFVKSALSRYSQYDFLDMVEKHGIGWEEREHGQLFCKESAKQIVAMLLAECEAAGVTIQLNCEVQTIAKDECFELETGKGSFSAESLVIASGSKSIPKMGATGFGHQVAEQFGLQVTELRAGLVPFRFTGREAEVLKGLAGISLPVTVSLGAVSFSEAMLITHRGLSGPAMLQISSYWREGDMITVNLLPGMDTADWLKVGKREHPRLYLHNALAEKLPKRVVTYLAEVQEWTNQPLSSYADTTLDKLAEVLTGWQLRPAGTEGYRTAEVTVGGVDTDELSSKTMEVKKMPCLYFIGEVVDVSGHLGGFNFQWAWSSGYCAGQFV
jgi:predicted Rossmann fold flavoprotein